MGIPVHVVAGFLGAGKTTTLRRLLAACGDERVAVVVNDFGEASIDEEVLGASEGVRIAEIRGACVCCTAPDGFMGAVQTLLDDVRPDRIFVEPTGLARPADLVDTLRRAPYAERIEIGAVVVVADPHVIAGEDHGLLQEQGEAADILIANRIDLCTEGELIAFDAWAESLWPGPALVLKTQFGKLPIREVLHMKPTSRPQPDHRHHHDHPFDVDSRHWPADVVFSKQRLTELPLAGVSRLKGLFRTEEGVFLMEWAGDQRHERATSYRRDSRVDVIVPRGQSELLQQVLGALDQAILSAEELAIRGDELEVVLPDGQRKIFDRAALTALANGVPDVSLLIPKRVGVAARISSLWSEIGASGGDVVVIAADGYATPSVPLTAVSSGVLVHSVSDGPLPADKGGPFRLLIPGDAGPGGPCANVKGVVRIVVRD
jgi:G3E family GTPase